MLRVVIVGDPESGKTTFLGLLYATEVKSGSDKADSLRFHAPLESLEAITLVYQQLMSGSFPDPVTKQAVDRIDFQLGTRRAGLFSRRHSQGPDGGDFSTIRFTLLRTSVGEVSPQRTGSSPERKSRTFDGSDVVVILVDSTKLAANGEPTQAGPMSTYDGAVESLLSSMQDGGHRLHYPIFIFSKFDRVSPEVLRSANVAAAPPGVGDNRPRATYAEALLRRNLPRTLAKVRAGDGAGPRLAGPAYFFSWLRTEAATPGHPERIRLRRGELTGWEPEYPSQEYLSFLGYLGDIASRYSE